jgi:hypothetical protein
MNADSTVKQSADGPGGRRSASRSEGEASPCGADLVRLSTISDGGSSFRSDQRLRTVRLRRREGWLEIEADFCCNGSESKDRLWFSQGASRPIQATSTRAPRNAPVDGQQRPLVFFGRRRLPGSDLATWPRHPNRPRFFGCTGLAYLEDPVFISRQRRAGGDLPHVFPISRPNGWVNRAPHRAQVIPYIAGATRVGGNRPAKYSSPRLRGGN